MTTKALKDLKRMLEPLGPVRVELTKNNHLKLTHVATGASKFFSKTPSDHRAALNMLSQFRRTIRERQTETCHG